MSNLRVPDLNNVIIAGRLTRDPELKYIASGRAVCELSVANTRYYKDKSGDRKEDTTFVSATVWDKVAEWVGESIKKGRPVLIEGRLRSESWEDKSSGQKRSRLLIMASRVSPLDWDGEKAPERSETRSAANRESTNEDDPIPDDDIPF